MLVGRLQQNHVGVIECAIYDAAAAHDTSSGIGWTTADDIGRRRTDEIFQRVRGVELQSRRVPGLVQAARFFDALPSYIAEACGLLTTLEESRSMQRFVGADHLNGSKRGAPHVREIRPARAQGAYPRDTVQNDTVAKRQVIVGQRRQYFVTAPAERVAGDALEQGCLDAVELQQAQAQFQCQSAGDGALAHPGQPSHHNEHETRLGHYHVWLALNCLS